MIVSVYNREYRVENFKKNGKLLSKEWFTKVSEFSNGYAAVYFRDGVNYIDEDGKLLFPKYISPGTIIRHMDSDLFIINNNIYFKNKLVFTNYIIIGTYNNYVVLRTIDNMHAVIYDFKNDKVIKEYTGSCIGINHRKGVYTRFVIHNNIIYDVNLNISSYVDEFDGKLLVTYIGSHNTYLFDDNIYVYNYWLVPSKCYNYLVSTNVIVDLKDKKEYSCVETSSRTYYCLDLDKTIIYYETIHIVCDGKFVYDGEYYIKDNIKYMYNSLLGFLLKVGIISDIDKYHVLLNHRMYDTYDGKRYLLKYDKLFDITSMSKSSFIMKDVLLDIKII